MNNQLALALELNYQASLADFFWGNNTLIHDQLNYLLSNPGHSLLYIWGQAGCGKSHLLQGYCQLLGHHGHEVAYLPLMLLKEWGPATLEGLSDRRLIAIDDIETIAGNTEWEEEFFHFYNRIRDKDETILLITAQHPPAKSHIQLADLRSRLVWGLVMQLHELSDDLKITALQHHAEKRGLQLSHQVALFLINRCARNMHALYQILNQLDNASLAAQRKITVPFVKDILKI